MKKVLQNFFGKTLILVSMLCAFVLAGKAQITMGTANCTITANEIQMDITVTNTSTADLRWNSTVLRMTVPAAIIPAGTQTYTFVYVGGSDFPATYVGTGLGAGLNASGASYTTATRLLTWTTGNTSAYSNAGCPASTAPLITAGQTKNIGRYSFKITSANFISGQNATFVWSTTSSCNLYQACAGTVTGYTQASGLRTLATPCSLTVPVACAASVTGTTTPAACFGGATGTATAIPSGTTAPIAYTIAGPTVNTSGASSGTFTGLTAGSYTISLSDANGCTASTAPLTVGQPTQVVANESHTSVLCSGGSSAVTITGSGGTPPYSGTGTFPQTAGTQSYTVTDANGCTGSVSVTVTAPSPVVATETHTTVACFGGNSTVTVSATGGTPPYTGTGTFSQGAGTVSYPVSDANGCTASVSATVVTPSQIVLSESHTAITCGGSSTVTISATGGTPPYTGTGNFTQGAGTTSYNVTDANGCVKSISVTVSSGSGPTAAESHTAIACFGGSSTVTITATGGVPPYVGTGTFTRPAGTYIFTVTDANSCPSNVTVVITQPAQLVGSETHTAIACNGGNSTVTISATGGTPPLSGTGTFTRPAGTHSFTVTDANGCTSVVSVTITQPSLLVATESHTAIACNGGTSTVTVSATGGTPPYTGTGTFTHPAGTFPHIVTDANGCTSTATAVITQPAALTAPVVSVSQPTCSTLGTITFTSPAPAAGIFYSIDGTTYTNTTGVFTIAAAGGSFTATYRVGTCTSSSVTAVVNAQPATPATPGITSVSNGNGTYNLTATGITGSLLWSTGATTATITVSPSATPYCVSQTNGTCTSGTNCITVANVLADPAVGNMQILSMASVPQNTNTLLFATQYKLTLPIFNLSQTEALPNGTTIVTIDLGTKMVLDPAFVLATAPLSSFFTWTYAAGTGPLAGHQIITGTQIALIPADYADVAIFTVRGSSSCTSKVNASIVANLTDEDSNNNAAQMTYTFPVTVSAIPTNATCNGLSNGAIVVISSPGTSIIVKNSLNVTVGTGPFTSGLPAGVYTVIASALGDGPTFNTCLNTTTVTITQPPVLTATVSVTPNVCYGANTGTATVLPTGGTPSYSYLWNTVPAQTTQTAIGLTAGTYLCTITDANGCSYTIAAVIAQPGSPISLSTSGSQVTCNGLANGTATVTATGGTPPYTYLWNTVPAQTNPTAVNLVAGTYSVIVTDANGCTAAISRTVTQPLTLSFTISGSNVICNGGNTGSATVSAVSGGTPPYAYSWSPSGGSAATASGLTAGTYVCTITDANGCTTTATYTVTQPTALVIAPTHSNVNCFGGNNGTITVNASGGSPAYSYAITPGVNTTGATTGVFTGLPAGTYTITVTDTHACVATGSQTITQPGTSVSVTTSGVNILCFGNNTGSATAIPAGGTPPYTYVWNTVPMQTTATAIGLVAGTYTVTVTDANGCSATGTRVVTQPGTPVSASISGVNVLCNGGNTGSATAVASGGTPPYTYAIAGPTVNATGLNSGAFTGLTSGVYTITCTDANGCTASASYTVTQPALALVASLAGVVGNTCNSGNVGSISVTAIGGTPAYVFTIVGPTVNTTGAVTGVFTGLTGGTYTITCTDANGCTSSVTATVTAPTGLFPDLSLGSDFTSNFFATNGIQNTVMFNVAEVGGNPAVGDTIRITKVAGYILSFDNTATSLVISSVPYVLNNPQWKMDVTNPAFVSLIKMHPTNPSLPGTIQCGTLERVSLKILRNTPNISTFTLSSRIRRANGETNLLNNLSSVIFTAE